MSLDAMDVALENEFIIATETYNPSSTRKSVQNLTISRFLALFRLWAGKVLVQMVRLVKHPENTMMMCPSQTFAAAWYWSLCISLCLWWLFFGAYPIASLGSLSNNICSSASPRNKTLRHYIICLLLHLFISLQVLALGLFVASADDLSGFPSPAHLHPDTPVALGKWSSEAYCNRCHLAW